MSALSPARVADTARAAIKAKLMNPMALDQIAKQNELFLADYVKRLSFAGQKVPTEVTEFNGYVEGVPFSTLTTVEKVDGAPDKVISGLIGNTGIEKIDNGFTVKGKDYKFTYTEVFENFFVGSSTNAKRFLDKSGKPVSGDKMPKGGMTNPVWAEAVFRREIVAKEFGGANIGSWSIVADKYVPDIRTKAGTVDAQAGKAARAATADVPDTRKSAPTYTAPSKGELNYRLNLMRFSRISPGDYDTVTPGGIRLNIRRRETDGRWGYANPETGEGFEDTWATLAEAKLAAAEYDDIAKHIAATDDYKYSPKGKKGRKGRKAVDAVPPVKGVDAFEAFDPIAANFATYVRHWQDSMESIELDWSRATGKEIKRTLVMDRVSSRFSPRNNNGDFLLEDADIANNSRRSGVNYSGKTPGATPKALKQRKLRNDEVRELANEGQYSLSSPMVALKEHQLSMAKSAWDEQLKKHLKVLAKKKGSGVISISVKKSQAKRAISQILVNKGDVKPKTIASIKEQFPATAEALTKAMTHKKGTKIREKALKDIVNILESDTSELLDKTYIPTKAGAVTSRVSGAVGKKDRIISRQERMPAYTGLYFEDKGEVNRLVKQHYPNNSLADDNSLITATNNFSKILAETGDIIRLGKTGFDLHDSRLAFTWVCCC